MYTPIIELKQISKTYTNGHIDYKALKEIDFKVQKGEFVVVSGPSGCGKSTILNIIAGLDTPSSGCVRFNGQNIGSKSEYELNSYRNKDLGVIFQNFNLIPVFTAQENIAFPLKIAKERKSVIQEKVANKLNEVGLRGKGNQLPHQLSGGQKQRVAIARAMVMEPTLIIADEPTSSLDSKTGIRILDLMRAQNEKYGTTFIIATHDEQVMKRASRLISIKDGTLN
jgi:putative ABC transport system ATP-binding protein